MKYPDYNKGSPYTKEQIKRRTFWINFFLRVAHRHLGDLYPLATQRRQTPTIIDSSTYPTRLPRLGRGRKRGKKSNIQNHFP